MLGVIRDNVAPVASWTALWMAFGALMGGASFAAASALGVPMLGLTGMRITMLAALAFGFAGFFSALSYHGFALRGRPPRQLSASSTLLYGALAGVLPMAMWLLGESSRGREVARGVSALVGMGALGAATALVLRWRDRHRDRMYQERQQLAEPHGAGLEGTLRRESTERAAT